MTARGGASEHWAGSALRVPPEPRDRDCRAPLPDRDTDPRGEEICLRQQGRCCPTPAVAPLQLRDTVPLRPKGLRSPPNSTSFTHSRCNAGSTLAPEADLEESSATTRPQGSKAPPP